MMSEAEAMEVAVGGDQATVLIERLDDGAFRVAECPWFVEEFGYDDIIELELRERGVARFVRIAQVSRLSRSWFVLDPSVVSSPALQRILDEVRASGGYWERAMGGALFTAVPSESGMDVSAALDRVMRTNSGEGRG